MKRLECLDGLRGLLAMYVLLNHLAPFAALPLWMIRPFSHGEAAVDVFFILSGLVIVRSLESFAWQPRPFLIARAARIFPVFLVMFAIAVPVQALPDDFALLPWIGPHSPAFDIWSVGWPRAWLVEIVAHLTMTHGLIPDAVVPAVWISFLGSAWSLSTEWQFYVLALAVGARIGPRWMIAAFLALGACGVAWSAIAPDGWAFSRAFLPNKAQYFALGIAGAALVRGGARAGWIYAATLGASMVLCALQGGVEKLGVPAFWTLCLAGQLRPDAAGLAPIARVLRSPVLLRLGALSYCIYLANEPIQRVLGVVLAMLADGDARWFTIVWLPAALLLPLAAAAWLHAWIEMPALRWGRAYARQFPRESLRPRRESLRP
ncbi:MAG TPA: acyltransferase [Acetobacteraceae bacterium]|jgi:peptidoglycan/LPS O-acetylase OafA/YrhL